MIYKMEQFKLKQMKFDFLCNFYKSQHIKNDENNLRTSGIVLWK